MENINIRQIMKEAVLRNGIIVDVRDRDSFKKAHIPMAICIPFEDIESGYFRLPKGRDIICYCDTGATSIRAANLLSRKGYKTVNCVGGILSYKGSLTS